MPTSSPTGRDDPSRDRRIMVTGALLFCGGSAIFYILPAFMALLSTRLSLSPSQMGMLAAVESLAIAIASLSAPLWINRLNRRHTVIFGVIVCLIGNSLTAFSGDYHAILAIRAVVGLVGEGLLGPIAFATISALREPDRAIGVAVTAAVAMGAAIMAAASTLTRLLPAFGPIAAVLFVQILILPFARGVLLAQAPRAAEGGGHAPGAGKGILLLALLAQALWAAGPGAFWTFAEHIALANGIAKAPSELALSIGTLASLLGSMAAVMLGGRFGWLAPVVGSTLVMILLAFLYVRCDRMIEVALCLSAFYILWNYGLVYQLGFLAELDTTGRYAAAIPAAQVCGTSIGPLLAGEMMMAFGNVGAPIATAICATAGVALYLLCFARTRRDAVGKST